MGGLVKRENKSIENDIDSESEDNVLLKVDSVINTLRKLRNWANSLSTFKIYL